MGWIGVRAEGPDGTIVLLNWQEFVQTGNGEPWTCKPLERCCGFRADGALVTEGMQEQPARQGE